MQRSQVQLLSTMVEELTFAGAPLPALAPLTALRSELSKRDPSYFNDAENFKDSTAEALDVQREARGSYPLWPARIAVLITPDSLASQVFLLLAEEASWEEGDAEEAAAAATQQELHLEVVATQRKYSS